MQVLSGPGLLVYGFTITYAAIDWVMSLDPSFFSTIYGMIFMVLPAITALALAVIVVMKLAPYALPAPASMPGTVQKQDRRAGAGRGHERLPLATMLPGPQARGGSPGQASRLPHRSGTG